MSATAGSSEIMNRIVMKCVMKRLRCPICEKGRTDKSSDGYHDDGARLVQASMKPNRKMMPFSRRGVQLFSIFVFGYFIIFGTSEINTNVMAQEKSTEASKLPESEKNQRLVVQLMNTCFGKEPKLPPTVGEDTSDILKFGKIIARQSTEMLSELAGLPKLSESDRRNAGDDLTKSIYEEYGQPKAGVSGQRVEKLSAKLLEFTKRPNDLCCNFQVLPSRDFNAYMGPGGRGFVLEGLISKTRSDDQLAFVIAHEISHALLEHPEKSMRILLAAGRIGKDLTGTDAGAEASELIASATTDLLSKAYSQDEEYEADRLGLCLTYLAGFQQKGGSEFMDIMSQITKEKSVPSGGVKRITYDLFTSHPPAADRKKYLDSLAKLIAKQNSTNKK